MLLEIKTYFELVLLITLWFCFSIFLMYLGSNIFLSTLGFLTWPIIEYLAHRYAHRESYSGPHQIHHRDNKNITYQIVPQFQAIGITVILMIITGYAFTGGIVLAYSLYEIVHELSHIKGAAKKLPQPLKWMAIHHLRHHAKQNTNYSVTLPLIDYLMGTAYKKK